jgi:hypothetical protein
MTQLAAFYFRCVELRLQDRTLVMARDISKPHGLPQCNLRPQIQYASLIRSSSDSTLFSKNEQGAGKSARSNS